MCCPPKPTGRICVVIVSVFLGYHTISKLFCKTLTKLPFERFEVEVAPHAKTDDAA
jgi:hypothetical protein